MAGSRRSGGERRPQDSYVERFRADPGQGPTDVVELSGLLGDSERAGRRRLYFDRSLTWYAEFREADVLAESDLPADAPPMVGVSGTRVVLPRAAQVEWVENASWDQLDHRWGLTVGCPCWDSIEDFGENREDIDVVVYNARSAALRRARARRIALARRRMRL